MASCIEPLDAVTGKNGEPAPARDPFGDGPPIPLVCIISMALILVSGIYLVSYLPRSGPLGPAIGLVIASVVALVVAVGMLARLEDFDWSEFFLVVKWTLLAYAVIGGVLEYVFVNDGTRGPMLVLLTISIFVYAVDVPLLFGYSVARFSATRAAH